MKSRAPGRPRSDDPADHDIVMRVTRTRKNAYVRAAQKSGRNLTRWITSICDSEIERIRGTYPKQSTPKMGFTTRTN